MFQNKMNVLKEDRTLNKWLINFEDYISQNNKYNIGPVITNTFVLNGISKKNQTGYKQNKIKCYFDKSEKNFNKVSEYILENWEAEKKINSNLINEPRCGVKNLDILDEELKILFYKTDYKNFIGTNKSITKEKFHIYIGEIERSIMNSKEGYKNLNNSVLSNDLATATTIITKDKKIILSQRSNEVYLLKGLIHTSIAEGMHFENDWDN